MPTIEPIKATIEVIYDELKKAHLNHVKWSFACAADSFFTYHYVRENEIHELTLFDNDLIKLSVETTEDLLHDDVEALGYNVYVNEERVRSFDYNKHRYE